MRLLAGLALGGVIGFGQASLSFDVATIKASQPEAATRHFQIQGRRFVTTGTSLADLIQFAYGLHPRQVLNGPKWLESDKFDVTGASQLNRPPAEPEWMQMMADLLVSRFQLRFHREKRELPVYAITLTRTGPKLESSVGPQTVSSFAFHGRGQLVASHATLSDLAWELQSAILDQPVVDQSGLTSRFNFTLTWSPDEFQKPALTGDSPAPESTPSIFTALQQQLGLRLEAAKATVDVMVIDGVAPPSGD